MSSATKARLQALGAAALFSTGGAAVKTAAFSAAQIASFRAGIAAIALLLWLGGRVRLSKQAWAVGVVYACMTVLYVASTKLTTSASAIFLAIYIGLRSTLLVGAALYVCALVVILATRDRDIPHQA